MSDILVWTLGTPDEFVQALYAVGRGFRIGGDSSSTDAVGYKKFPSGSGGFRSTSEEDSDTSAGKICTNLIYSFN